MSEKTTIPGRDRDGDLYNLTRAWIENLEWENCEYGGWNLNAAQKRIPAGFPSAPCRKSPQIDACGGAQWGRAPTRHRCCLRNGPLLVAQHWSPCARSGLRA